MNSPFPADLPDVLSASRVRVVFGAGSVRKLGLIAADEGATRVLLISDPGLMRAGHVQRAADSLRQGGLEVTIFGGARENPTTREVDAGVVIARDLGVNFLIGLGGGSSMDCAKGINFVLTNGGRMEDYRGVGKATKPMLPMICIPTTAGTGSEAQSFALIADAVTHQKMACGDEKALPRVAILDPELIATVPRGVAAATGIDAIAHAIETAGCRKRNDVSRALSREAWTRLSRSFETYVNKLRPAEEEMIGVRRDMLLGAHLAGAAIEKSMLGAAHSCANPLTSEYGVTHGIAVGLMLPHVIRFNAGIEPFGGARGENPYSDLCDTECPDAEALAVRVEKLLDSAGLPRRLCDVGVEPERLGRLAELAATQWTLQFNPRAAGEDELLDIYQVAYD